GLLYRQRQRHHHCSLPLQAGHDRTGHRHCPDRHSGLLLLPQDSEDIMARVGLDASIGEEFLAEFSSAVELVRIPDEPKTEIAVDFWCPSIYAATAKRQWPHLRGVQVVQSLYAGVDALLSWLPRTVTLCDARGVHDIPIAEWAVAAV